MIFPKAHTACSQTFWCGEWSSLRKSGTASERYKKTPMQLLRNTPPLKDKRVHIISSSKKWDIFLPIKYQRLLRWYWNKTHHNSSCCLTEYTLQNTIKASLKITWHAFTSLTFTEACQDSKFSYIYYLLNLEIPCLVINQNQLQSSNHLRPTSPIQIDWVSRSTSTLFTGKV